MKEKLHSAIRGVGAMTAALAGIALMTANIQSAHAGSVTQPGETIGLALGAPLPVGWYGVNTVDYGQATPPSNVYVGANIPVLAWSTPYHLLGARVQALVAAPAVEAGTPNSHAAGWYNPFLGGWLAWDLGNSVGVSYILGFYPGVASPVADHSGSLNQRVALSYTPGTFNFTANFIYGNQISSKTNPDFLNIDLTATEGFGKFSVGPVGYISTDTSKPYAGYKSQSQFALGALVGYTAGPVLLQAYLTRDVAQTNYGGDDTRFWARILVPFS